MTCGYCQFANSEEEHRCRRCGRRLTGSAVSAPAHLAREHVRMAVQALGANALAATRVVAAEPHPVARPVERKRAANAKAPEIPIDTAATLDELPRTNVLRSGQPSLFGAELQPKIIPFEGMPRTASPASEQRSRNTPGSSSVLPIAPEASSPDQNAGEKKPLARTRKRTNAAGQDDPQATLDFLPPQKIAARTLKTSAQAVIFCDVKAAAPMHRAAAATLDLGMIAAAFGIVLVIFQMAGHPGHLDRFAIVLLAGMFGITSLFYGLLFTIAGAVTPGMRWTNLRIINFDGFEPEGRNRALRFLGCWISVLSGGIGLLWALLDEEGLTWHDHISKTFPALQESTSTVVRERQR